VSTNGSIAPEEGTVLWALPDGATGAAIDGLRAAVHEFNLGVHCCTYAELPELVRTRRCELVGIELGADLEAGTQLIKRLHERLPALTIFAATSDPSMAVLRAVLEAGASDVLSLPLGNQELHKALIKFSQLRTKNGPAHAAGSVLTVYGVRGGLGATTLAVNLASRLHTGLECETSLVDLDLQRGDVGAFLNLTPVNSLAALANATGPVDEIFLAGTLTRHTSGLFLLPAPSEMEEADTIGHKEVEMALRLLRPQFRFTIVDTSRMITAPVLAAFEQSDRVLMLTDLSVPSVRTARRTIELLERLSIPRERVDLIVTQVIPGPVPLADAARAIGKEVYHVLPRDEQAAAAAMNAGTTITARESGLAVAIADLADKLVGKGGQAKAKRGHLLQRIFAREARA
jgi:pilus assembly protein CpaE